MGPSSHGEPSVGSSHPPPDEWVRGSPVEGGGLDTACQAFCLTLVFWIFMPQGHLCWDYAFGVPFFRSRSTLASTMSVRFLGLLGVWSGLVFPFFLRAVNLLRPTTEFAHYQQLLLPLPLPLPLLLLLLLLLLLRFRWNLTCCCCCRCCCCCCPPNNTEMSGAAQAWRKQIAQWTTGKCCFFFSFCDCPLCFFKIVPVLAFLSFWRGGALGDKLCWGFWGRSVMSFLMVFPIGLAPRNFPCTVLLFLPLFLLR